MRLLTCLLPGDDRPVVAVAVEGGWIPLPALARTGAPGTELSRDLARLGMAALLAADPGLGAVRAALLGADPAALRRAAVPEAALRLLAPVPDAGKIVCVGHNYRRHIEEQGIPAPDRPALFAKLGNAIAAPGQPVVHPAQTHALDLEAELAVVIGRRARRVDTSAALACVAGYTAVNDISARDLQGQRPALRPGEQGDGQWLRAKSSDAFLPMGPLLATADELPPGGAGLAVRSFRTPGAGPGAGREVPMQEGRTDDLVFGVAELIAFISAVITLEPGDVVATGTPSGVGVWRDPPVFLLPGDSVRVEIEGIGSLVNPIVAADGSAPAGSPAALLLAGAPHRAPWSDRWESDR